MAEQEQEQEEQQQPTTITQLGNDTFAVDFSVDDPPEAEAEEAEGQEAPEEEAEAEEEISEADPEPEQKEEKEDEEPAPEGDETGSAESDEDEAAASPEEPAKEPFEFKSHGKRIPVDGAYTTVMQNDSGEDEEVIVIPREKFNRVMAPRIATSDALLKQKREYERQIADLDPESNEEVVRAKAIVAEMETVLHDEAALRSFLKNFEPSRAAMKARVDNAVLKAGVASRDAKATRSAAEEAASRQADMMVEDLPATLDAVYSSVKDQVPEGVFQEFQKYAVANLDRYYVIADTKEKADALGLELNGIGRKDAVIQQDFEAFVSAAKAANGGKFSTTTEAPATKRERVAKANRARTGKKAPPDAATPKKSAPADPEPAPMSREQWNEWKRGQS